MATKSTIKILLLFSSIHFLGACKLITGQEIGGSQTEDPKKDGDLNPDDKNGVLISFDSEIEDAAFQSEISASGECANWKSALLIGDIEESPLTLQCTEGKFEIAATLSGAEGEKDLQIQVESKAVADFKVKKKFCAGTALSSEPFAGGDGSQENPFLICTATQLNAIGAETNEENLDKNYLVRDEINLKSLTGKYNVIGKTYQKSFKGTFDGDEKELSNFTINSANQNNLITGLFGNAGAGAVIKNVKLVDVSIKIGMSGSVGALVGNFQGTLIDNCHISGNLEIGAGTTAGLIAGDASALDAGAVIANSSTRGTVKCTATGSDSGGNIGGLVGSMFWGTIEKSYSSATVISLANQNGGVGGLVGWFGGDGSASGEINESYASGEIRGNNAGGLVGILVNAVINNSYSTGDVIGEGSGNFLGSSNIGRMNHVLALGSSSSGFMIGSDAESLTDPTYENDWNSVPYSPTSGSECYFASDEGVLQGTASGLFSACSGLDDAALMASLSTFGAGGLGWSTSLWSFANGSYPKLSWQP